MHVKKGFICLILVSQCRLASCRTTIWWIL